MTVANFVKQTKVRLHSDGKHLIIPCMARTEEEKESIYAFCRMNRQEIIAYLMKGMQKKAYRAALDAAVRQKALDVMVEWEEYLYAQTSYVASGSAAEKPAAPDLDVNEAVASLNPQEYAYYKACLFAKSCDLDKARCGEKAMAEIAEASQGYDRILSRMQEDYENRRYQRERDGEAGERYGRYLDLVNAMHPRPVRASSYYAEEDAYMEMIG